MGFTYPIYIYFFSPVCRPWATRSKVYRIYVGPGHTRLRLRDCTPTLAADLVV